jgi:hypothetical protein
MINNFLGRGCENNHQHIEEYRQYERKYDKQKERCQKERGLNVGGEALEPGARCLFETIKRLVECPCVATATQLCFLHKYEHAHANE